MIKKDENIKMLVAQRTELERKHGVPLKDRQSGTYHTPGTADVLLLPYVLC